MLIVLSPAKRLDFAPQSLHKVASKPEFLAHSKQLIAQLRQLSPQQLSKLMSISDKLAADVHEYVKNWKVKFDTTTAKQALLAFRGDVYLGLEADKFSTTDFDFAQQHVRILSGLYGVLRPLDLIQPYRLVMGSQLAGDHGNDLYSYWGDRIAKSLKKTLAGLGDDVLVNLASNEYFKAARASSFDCRVITPVFKDRNAAGEYKVMSFFAKKARGMMARHIISQRVTDESGILKFHAAGYKYNRGQSSEGRPVFTREKAPAAE